MSHDKVKKWRKETKARLVEAFGGKCGIGRLFGVSGNSVKKQYLKQLRTVE